MSERRVGAFFYRVLMDVDVLSDSGVTPIEPRRAYVDHFALRIGQRATLVPSIGGRAYGMLVALTMGRMRFTDVSEVLWRGRDRWAYQVDRRTGHGAILSRASGSARAATAKHA